MMVEALNYEHLGKVIAFSYHLPRSKVFAELTGELREVQHDMEGTTVWLSGDDSNGEKEEITLNPTTKVRFV